MTVNRIICQSNFLRENQEPQFKSIPLIQSAKINQIDRFHTEYHLSSDQGAPDRDDDELYGVCLMSDSFKGHQRRENLIGIVSKQHF